ncbi:phosphoadenosine phosphosulfate reductase [Malaciobacter marinus]|uniref:Adenosine 5'-phosphosulfate reductase n=1 Tax=Malaciobacter marinus TaxID=505249 RepID=A0A347TPF8_9BACT|nr:phosphoadenylyl-sulfate reductase [Malaciobacter marinus]AXX88486.1 phosphoadenosine phosphosulfate reductase [Malaciobacter marinus]PHO16588.1 phosphoadenylyl-sulfate reductase [Malaciobacter marinus]
MNIIDELNEQLKNSSTQEVIEFFLNQYRSKVALASSLGAEDQVLTDIIFKIDKSSKVFTLDTGRLNPETYDVMDATNLKYGVKLDVYFPNLDKVEQLYQTQGINGHFESIDNRKKCCNIRKIEPLKRALKNLDVWFTGLRSSQSITREDMKLVEWDEAFKLIKVNPLIKWSEKDVWDYIKANSVPYNKLHDKGYPSIGCAPCTRAVKDGEDIRAGRWWWENPEHKECGLHKK